VPFFRGAKDDYRSPDGESDCNWASDGISSRKARGFVCCLQRIDTDFGPLAADEWQ